MKVLLGKPWTLGLCGLLLFSAAIPPANAAEPRSDAARCEAKTLRAAGRLANCRLRAEGRRAKAGDPRRHASHIEKCEARFMKSFARAVARFGESNCPGDAGQLLGGDIDDFILARTSAYAGRVDAAVSGCSQENCASCTFANFPTAPHGSDNRCFTFKSSDGYCCVQSGGFFGTPGGNPSDGCQFTGLFPDGCQKASGDCATESVCRVPQTPPPPPSPTTVRLKNYTAQSVWVNFRFGASVYSFSDLPAGFCSNTPTAQAGCHVQLSAFSGAASNCPTGSCIEIPNPDKKQIDLAAAFSKSKPSVFPTCDHTLGEANLNNTNQINVVDISVNDGYNAVLQIKHVAAAGGSQVVAGPNAKGIYGNAEILGVFPYGCDDCAPHSARSGTFEPGGALFALCGDGGTKPPGGVTECAKPGPCKCPAPSETVCNDTTCVCADRCHDCPSGQYNARGTCIGGPAPVCQLQFDGTATDGFAEIGVQEF